MEVQFKELRLSFSGNCQSCNPTESILGFIEEDLRVISQKTFDNSNTNQSRQNNYHQQLEMNPLKKVHGIKKKKTKKQRKVQIAIKQIPALINCDDILQLSTTFAINNQGIIKLGFQLEHISFGFQQTQLTNYLQDNQIFQIHILNNDQKPQISVEQALDYILHTPCKQIQEVRNALLKYKLMQKSIFNLIDSIDKKEEFLLFYNEELNKHINSCNEYVKKYAQENEEQMFQYLIGRINFQKRDVEIVQAGYSKSFLELIGLNAQSLSFLLMRNQKVDLLKDEEEMMKQSLVIFQNNKFTEKEIKLSFKITTFDGFEIILYQTKRLVYPTYLAKKFSNLPLEYIFSIINYDVDLEDLKNLITYRQKILQNRNNLTFDEFINKELSFLFESVEYSVLSQNLIEKFYLNNIEELQKINDSKKKKN